MQGRGFPVKICAQGEKYKGQTETIIQALQYNHLDSPGHYHSSSRLGEG